MSMIKTTQETVIHDAQFHHAQAVKRLQARKIVPTYKMPDVIETATLLAAMLGHKVEGAGEAAAAAYLASQYTRRGTKPPKTADAQQSLILSQWTQPEIDAANNAAERRRKAAAAEHPEASSTSEPRIWVAPPREWKDLGGGWYETPRGEMIFRHKPVAAATQAVPEQTKVEQTDDEEVMPWS